MDPSLPSASTPSSDKVSGDALLWKLTRNHRSAFLVGSLTLVLVSVLGLSIPLMVREGIQTIEEGDPNHRLAFWAGCIALLSLLQALFRILSRISFLGTCRRAGYQLSRDLFDHLLTLDPGVLHQYGSGDLVSRLAHDIRSARALLGPGLMHGIGVFVQYTVALTMMFSLSVPLTLWALAPIPIALTAYRSLTSRFYWRFRASHASLSALSDQVSESVGGIEILKAFLAEEQEEKRFEAVNGQHMENVLALARIRCLMQPISTLLSGVSTLLLLVVGGRMILDGSIALGDLIAFYSYIGALVWPTIALGWILNLWQRGRAAYGRLAEVFSLRPQIVGPPIDRFIDRSPRTQDSEDSPILHFHHLTCRHSNQSRSALEEIGFTVNRGEILGIAGRIGSGKSTLLASIARLIPAPEGSILLDNVPIEQFQLSELRARMAYVPQNPYLFSRSIETNIAFGVKNASQQSILQAARSAGLGTELDSGAFPEGLATPVGERGHSLSGGQRQRTALARGWILPRADLLLLDDPISMLDHETEQKILSRLRSDCPPSTVLLATHRFTALAACDRVLVLDQGRQIDLAPHDILLQRCAIYQEMEVESRRKTEERRRS